MQDQIDIQALTDRFFGVFTNTSGRKALVRDLPEIFIPQGTIVNNTTGSPQIYDLNSFILPREKMLTDGTLTNFRERELHHETTIHGNIAQRICKYEKAGELHGKHFEATGWKSIQFIKVEGEWKMSSVIWWDE